MAWFIPMHTIELSRDKTGDLRWNANRQGHILADSGEGYKRIGKLIRTLHGLLTAKKIRICFPENKGVGAGVLQVEPSRLLAAETTGAIQRMLTATPAASTATKTTKTRKTRARTPGNRATRLKRLKVA
jgi:hypothetical protein